MARTPPARTIGQAPLLAVTAAILLVYGATEIADRSDAPAATAGGDLLAGEDPEPVEAEPGRTAQVVGPALGADVAAYVDDRTTALLEAPDTVDTAVVSFTDTLLVADALTLVEGSGGAVRAVLVRLPVDGTRPATVRVEAGADPVAAVQQRLESALTPLVEEEEELRRLLDGGTVEDDAFVEEYERRLGQIADARAAVEGDGPVAFGVVLRAPLEALQGLVDATAVRLVDPAPPGTDIATSTFYGLLPEDGDTVTQGRTG